MVYRWGGAPPCKIVFSELVGFRPREKMGKQKCANWEFAVAIILVGELQKKMCQVPFKSHSPSPFMAN